MTTSKQILTALQFNYQDRSLKENFQTLSRLIKNTPKNAIVLAPELCLSGYRYDSLEDSASFTQSIVPLLKELSTEKTFALTMIEKEGNTYFNSAKIFSFGEIIYSRPKARLFPLGDEEKYFSQGNDKDIQIIQVNGIKIAILVCFELRFSELWKQIQGADVILIPSYWGNLRKEHLKVLSHALAIANQAFVVVANSSDEDMASSSAIISPFGDVFRDDSSFIIQREVDLNEIKKMRRYINIGID